MSTHKQVLVVRKDLNMRKGKIGAQCAHASMQALLSLCDKRTDGTLLIPNHPDISAWLNDKFTKVVVSVNSEAELLDVFNRALESGIICAMTTDSGLTEFHGVPTNTVVAVGPASIERVDAITGEIPGRSRLPLL